MLRFLKMLGGYQRICNQNRAVIQLLIFQYRITVTRNQLLARIPKPKTVIGFKFHAECA